jgi:hypothetical protein
MASAPNALPPNISPRIQFVLNALGWAANRDVRGENERLEQQGREVSDVLGVS